MSKSSANEVREPQQLRSILRTDQILEAAEKIIAEKGAANLTISEIAQTAQVTPASMYQYFHNKSAIVLALATRYAQQLHQMFQNVYATRPQTLEEHAERLFGVLEGYYRIHRQKPVIRDIWMAAATNKDMQHLAREEAMRNQAFHVELAAPFFPESVHEEMARTLLILTQFGIASANLALEQPEEEARKTLQSAMRMIHASWWTFASAHARV